MARFARQSLQIERLRIQRVQIALPLLPGVYSRGGDCAWHATTTDRRPMPNNARG
jgi:hypothetical protein